MRVNVYAEEMTNRIQIISKEIDGQRFTGLRIYLELPVTIGAIGGGATTHRSEEGPTVCAPLGGGSAQVAGPFIHRPGDDDSSAVTFWGKRDLREVLREALAALDAHYEGRSCEHRRLLNRGCPPNTTNLRMCVDCGKTIQPSEDPNGTNDIPDDPTMIDGACYLRARRT